MLDPFLLRLFADGSIDLTVRVRPGASITAVKQIMDDGSVKIDVAAAAEDGEANEELIRFLADQFHVPASAIQILSGKNARQKMIRIGTR